MYPRASIASFPRSVQSTPNPLGLGPYCLTHFALTIKSSASERYSSGVLDSFGIHDGKRFLRRRYWVVRRFASDGWRVSCGGPTASAVGAHLRGAPSCDATGIRLFLISRVFHIIIRFLPGFVRV